VLTFYRAWRRYSRHAGVVVYFGITSSRIYRRLWLLVRLWRWCAGGIAAAADVLVLLRLLLIGGRARAEPRSYGL